MDQPCATCPFRDLTPAEKGQAVEGGGCLMLCHESQCLDGERPDRPCIGFYGTAAPTEETQP